MMFQDISHKKTNHKEEQGHTEGDTHYISFGLKKDSIHDVTAITVSFHRSFCLFFCVTLLRILAEIRIFKVCEESGYPFLYFALFLNTMYFIFGIVFVKRPYIVRFSDRRNLLFIFCTLFVTASGTWLAVMSETDRIGMYVVNAYQAVTVLVYGIICLCCFKNIWKKKEEVYMLTLHGLGFTSVLYYMTSRIHWLGYANNRQFASDLISGGTILYAQTLIFVILYAVWGCGKKGLNSCRKLKKT